TRPDLRQLVDGVDIGNDGMMARTLKPLVVERAARTSTNHRRLGYRDRAERLAHPQSGYDSRHVRYQALRQIANLCARISDNLLALAVIQILRQFEGFAGRPAKARAAKF